MSWIYIEREQYVRMSDKLGVSDDVRNSIKNWAVTVSNKSETPRLKVVFRTENNRYEAWSAGIPNPDSNKGKSGGYRLVYFLDLIEKTINLDYIELRLSSAVQSGDLELYSVIEKELEETIQSLAKLNSIE